MITALSLMINALQNVGADGLCNPDNECGCGIDDLAPCENLNLEGCVAAKWYIPSKGTPEYDDEDFQCGYYRAVET